MTSTGWPAAARCGAVLLVLSLAGCIDDIGKQTSIQVDHTGERQALMAERQLTCGDQVLLRFDIQRIDERLQIRILDGVGRMVLEEQFGGDGRAPSLGSDERNLFGEPGDWRLLAEWEGADIAFEARLTC